MTGGDSGNEITFPITVCYPHMNEFLWPKYFHCIQIGFWERFNFMNPVDWNLRLFGFERSWQMSFWPEQEMSSKRTDWSVSISSTFHHLRLSNHHHDVPKHDFLHSDYTVVPDFHHRWLCQNTALLSAQCYDDGHCPFWIRFLHLSLELSLFQCASLTWNSFIWFGTAWNYSSLILI